MAVTKHTLYPGQKEKIRKYCNLNYGNSILVLQDTREREGKCYQLFKVLLLQSIWMEFQSFLECLFPDFAYLKGLTLSMLCDWDYSKWIDHVRRKHQTSFLQNLQSLYSLTDMPPLSSQGITLLSFFLLNSDVGERGLPNSPTFLASKSINKWYD